MWILKRWKKSISLQQLSLSDEKSMKDSFMYKLSEQKVQRINITFENIYNL